MTLLLLYLTLALALSFICSVLEAVLLSVTPSYITMLEQRGRRVGRALQALKAEIDRPLSAILSLNTIAHTVGAVGVGAQAQVVFGNQYVTVTSAILTLLILVVSEIIPKTLGARYWRVLAPLAVPVLRWLTILLAPLVWLSLKITGLMAEGEKPLSLSREEFSAMARRGQDEGVFDEDEARMLHNLMRFGSLSVTDVLTPRVVVVALDQDMTVAKLGERLPQIAFSRLPLYAENPENITGFILKTDVLHELARDHGSRPLHELKRPLLTIPESQSVRAVFRQLLERREHLAAVVDEYGGFSGIVTMEDLVETLLGLEIVDEVDTIDDMRALARERWMQRAQQMGLIEPGGTLPSVERATDAEPR